MPIRATCPGCKKSFNAPDEYAGKKARCPACKASFTVEERKADKINTQAERPPSRPVISDLKAAGHKADLLDYVVYFSFMAIPIICTIGIGLMLFGSGDLLLLLGGACLLLSLFFLMKYSHMKSTIRKQDEEIKQLALSVSTRTTELENAVSKFREFESSFDTLVTKEYDRLKVEFADAERMFEYANNREKTIDQLGKRLLGDSVKWISAKMTPNNFTSSSDRLRKVIAFCRKHEYSVADAHESELLGNLRSEFESVLRKAHAREEQARIKARIREEQKAEKELDREMRRIEAEKAAIEKALKAALRDAKDEHSAEVESLREKLRDAEEKSRRALSMAQQTKAGHVYVISNIGSFGEEVFKIGMTRRLEPLDRVKELGDASVPFPFDVHMMISCDDAPKLESTLHKAFHNRRLNKVNLRREFFRVDIAEIRRLVEEHHGEVDYVAEPEALQYRESTAMSDEDYAYVSSHNQDLDFADDDDYVG